jgi:hypothetical protein
MMVEDEFTDKKIHIQLIKKIKQGDDGKQLTREDIELATRNETLEGSRQDRLARKKFTPNLFWLLVVFLSCTLSIVVLSGLRILCLSDTVLVTLLTTTTADVIGIFIFVVKYLFKSNG